jgi:hypothetical protein
MLLGVRQAEVGEDIAASDLYFYSSLFHSRLSPPAKPQTPAS